jgi:hypothetical protein
MTDRELQVDDASALNVLKDLNYELIKQIQEMKESSKLADLRPNE